MEGLQKIIYEMMPDDMPNVQAIETSKKIAAFIERKDKGESGFIKGELCNRNGCLGIIGEHEKEGSCSCHINPPCSYCVEASEYCPVCEWEAIEDAKPEATTFSSVIASYKDHRENVIRKMKGELPITDFDYISEGHTHFSMIKKGVYPPSMTRSELVEKIKGTFGGRFNRYGDGVFEYVAYTD